MKNNEILNCCREVTIKVGNCSLNVKTFIELIYFLRDKQNLKTYKESFFDLKREEQITDIIINKNDILKDNEKKIELFVNEMNKMFKKYQITTCYRRIHFLAQMYLETMSFRALQEASGKCNGYDGGCDFRGRGMKQLTHDYNYLGYYDYIYNTNYYDIFNKLRKGKYTSVKAVLNNNTILNEEFYINKLIPFTKKLSTDLFYAFDSAGWFSTIGLKGETNKIKLMEYMDKGLSNNDIMEVTKIINGGINNLKERQEYTKWIKEFFGVN
ncbi:hypothetical protein AFAEC_1445 [Aliarcobacter faecis]|uniref:hypothetical protein n=1 Tax=Aliarcobacter faecis TaxID=1564138 RepID=UPI00047D1B94|nr:hypothetical protein [Aliarcobacter faecis]QKF73604.1 hypothetical protein AFAEC_1445 [Aliarcobacter faecis]